MQFVVSHYSKTPAQCLQRLARLNVLRLTFMKIFSVFLFSETRVVCKEVIDRVTRENHPNIIDACAVGRRDTCF